MTQPERLVFWLLLSSTLAAVGLLTAPLCGAEPLPIARLAQVTFQVGDLEKARQFYAGAMGFEVAFQVKQVSGQSPGLSFEVNDDQFLVFLPGAAEEGEFHLERVSLLTPDIQRSRDMLLERNVAAGEIRTEADGNRHFAFADPDGTAFDFIQYMPGSLQSELRGKANGPRRVSRHLQHVGLAVADQNAAMSFYRDKLGFWETTRGGPAPGDIRWINLMMPGTHGDYVELMVHVADPVSRRQHLCFAVTDIQGAHKMLLRRGLPPQFRPFLAKTGQWLMNLRDPNGIRIEFMQVNSP